MAEHPDRPDLLPRHDTRDRVLHWLMTIAFLLAATSGLALFHPALFWLANLTGGGPWTAVLHPFIGLAMTVAFLAFALPHWHVNRLGPHDVAWLKGIRDVIGGHEDRVPEPGKYNAGQKLLFFSLLACVVVLTVTGFMIWRRYFAGYFPVGAVRLGALLHAFTAFVIICSIVVHVSAAVWAQGSIAAMLRGTVTLGWAYKHHRAWFREMIRPSGGR
jgi:formate dehydrogenase subunit gamma